MFKNEKKQIFLKKITVYLFLSFIILFYFNSRNSHFSKMSTNLSEIKTTIHDFTISSMDTIYNGDINDSFLQSNLKKSFPTEKIDFFKKLNNTIKTSNLTVKIIPTDICDFKNYKIETEKGYYYSFKFNLETYSNKESLVASEKKIAEIYILTENEELKITDLSIHNEN